MKLLILISLFFLVSCSDSEYVRYPICQKVDIEGGYILDCYGMEPITITNGVDGADGTSSDMQLVQLCPGDTATFPEQGIKSGNKLYAVFHSPPNTFLALITPGTYITTNGSNCKFKVNEDGTTEGIL